MTGQETGVQGLGRYDDWTGYTDDRSRSTSSTVFFLTVYLFYFIYIIYHNKFIDVSHGVGENKGTLFFS
jgi:hypothetical protein